MATVIRSLDCRVDGTGKKATSSRRTSRDHSTEPGTRSTCHGAGAVAGLSSVILNPSFQLPGGVACPIVRFALAKLALTPLFPPPLTN